jgi:hypothetical protein
MKTKSVTADLLSGLAPRQPLKPVKPLPNVNVKVEMEIDGKALAEWWDFLLRYEDVFYPEYIGYWAQLVARDAKRGLLICEMEYAEDDDFKKTAKAAIAAWRKGKPLAAGFHAIDKDIALKSFIEAAKQLGLKWQDSDDNDGPFQDYMIQRALFGEDRF